MRLVLVKVKNVSLLILIYLIFLLIAESVVLYLTLKTTMRRKDFLIGPPYVLIPKICKFTAYLKLDKQRIKCHHCNQSFTCKTDLVDFGCFISNPTKLSIASDLIKKEVKKISPLIMMFLLILLKELLTLIMILKNFISIIYPMFYALMNSNLLNLLMVP